ncbi:hypothetical protein [Streptomyces sp. NBC_01589]|uniref:hypothetical protein n=1 Tax=unclassified Streptomyces TaxID=2593676 RepID=UPI00386DE09E
MDITTRLQLLEAIRRADQADAAPTAAGRACTRAAVEALTGIGRSGQRWPLPASGPSCAVRSTRPIPRVTRSLA